MAPSPFLMTPQYSAGLKLGCQVGFLGVAALYHSQLSTGVLLLLVLEIQGKGDLLVVGDQTGR